MESLSFHIRGVAPLICHNSRLSDPLDEYAKAIAEVTSKRKKTMADHEEIAHREFIGSFYENEKDHPIIPSGNIERLFRDAAAKSKMGKQVQAGMIVPEDALIGYPGPKTREALWKGGKHALRASAKVGQQRVMRTRPCFRDWELEFAVFFDETILNPSAVRDFLELAGKIIGIGDWRPKHGRFEVVK